MDPLGAAAAGPVDLRALLAHEDEDFVVNAYQAILGRVPGPGESQAAEELRRGARKTDILARLRDSPEGRARGVEIRGLRGHERLDAWRATPVLGTLLAWIGDLLNRPALSRDIVTSHRVVRENWRLLVELGEGWAQVQDALARLEAGQAALSEESRRAALDREALRQIRDSLARLEQKTERIEKVEESVADMGIELAALLEARHGRLETQIAELNERPSPR